jgi:thioredoxin 1
MLHLIVSLVLLAPDAGPPGQTPPPPQAPPAAIQPQRPAPPLYNPTADAKAQIATALKSAKEDGIRVLVNWGANDDEPSKAFAAARRNRELSLFFADEYKVVNVDVGKLDKNLDVAQSYGVTLKAGSLPALAVLDADGNVLARTTGGAFLAEADPASYDVAKLAAFLTKHQAPPAPDAEPVFAAALKQAKADGKSLFVWFSAPW